MREEELCALNPKPPPPAAESHPHAPPSLLSVRKGVQRELCVGMREEELSKLSKTQSEGIQAKGLRHAKRAHSQQP